MRNAFVTATAALLLLLAAQRPSASQVLFSNFGVGDTFDTVLGWTQGYDTPPHVQGHDFSPSSTAQLNSVEIALNLASGPQTGILLKLFSDAAGQPGALLEQWDISGMLGYVFTTTGIVTVSSVSKPLLTAGTTYWLVPFVPTSTHAVWNWNSLADRGSIASTTNNGTTWTVNTNHVRGAFRVVGGAEVPEPGAWAFIVAGATGGLLLLRRRK